jgi:hypothetical protein
MWGDLTTPPGGAEGGEKGGGWQDFDWESFDPKEMVSGMWEDLTSGWDDAAGEFKVDKQGPGEQISAESLGYRWDPTSDSWKEVGGYRSRSQRDMDALIEKERRRAGYPGEAGETALELYEGDVNALREALHKNWEVRAKTALGSLGAAFEGALAVYERGQDTAEALRGRAEELGLESEEQLQRIASFVETGMEKAETLGQEAIETALRAESEWAQSLSDYKSHSAQTMSAVAIGIRRASAPAMSAIATGMHADGTPMSEGERRAMSEALNYTTGMEVHTRIAPMAAEREQTLLRGAQHASALTQATSQTQLAVGQQRIEETTRLGGLMLGAQQQHQAYSAMITDLTMASEQALSQSQLQATQLLLGGFAQAAQLYEDYNPVSYLAGFLNLLAIPRETWGRELGYDMEVV